MLRFLVAILCIMASYNILFASQNMIILDKNTDNFPEVSVNYFVFDDASVLPRHDIQSSQITVLDNGVNMPVINHTNYAGDVQKSVSFDICFDLGLNKTNGNYKFGIDMINYLLENFDFAQAEIALSAFDTYTFLYKDFTQDKDVLLDAIKLFHMSKGSDLNNIFTVSPGSITKVFEKGIYSKRSLIITDGNSNISLTAAQKQAYIEGNIQLNIISIGTTVSDDLKQLVAATNGIILENVSNTVPYQDYARTIFANIYNITPASLIWDASSSCEDVHNTEIYIPTTNSESELKYETSLASKRRLASLPSNIKFNPILPGNFGTKEIVIEAVNGEITIDKISLENDVLFEITEGAIGSSLILGDGDQHKVKVKYTPVDSTIQFTKLLIQSTACSGNEILIAAGYPNTPPKEKTIKLTSPDCNETLILGEEHYVEWEGLLPEDVIQLEYSLDNGKNWLSLDSNVRGLKYKWNLPQIETDEALVKIIQLWPNNVGQTMDLKHWAQVNSASFNQFGDRVVTASSDSSAIVWNSNTGVKILTLAKHSNDVNYAVFSNDGKYIATASKDSTVILWDATTGDSLGTVIQKEKINSVNFSHNSKVFVTATSDGTVKIYDVNTLSLVLNINAYTSTKRAWYAEFDPTDSYILTAGNSVYAKIYNAVGTNAGNLYKSFKVQEANYGDVAHATFNDNATKVALTSSNLKRTIVWDMKNLPDKDTYFIQDSLYSVSHNKDTSDNYFIRHASFARDKDGVEYLLTSGTDKKAYVWYAADGTLKIELLEHRSTVSTAVMNFDGSRVLTASWDSTAKVWNLDKRDLQMDTTDCTFSIKKPNITPNDITYGDIYRGNVIDSLFKRVIVNDNTFPIEVKSIKLVNDATEQFSLISKLDLPIKLMPTEAIDLEFSVYPKNSGNIKAQIEILTSGNATFMSEISANVLSEGLIVNNSYIDLGLVDFGEFKDSILTAVITNTNSVTINITDIKLDVPEPDNFRIIEGTDISSIAPGQSKTFKVRYTPSDNLRNNAVLTVSHDLHQYPARINLLGEGISPIVSSCTIFIPDVTGAPGDIIQLPIKIKNINEEGIRKTISGIKTYLSFNATLLAPVDTYDYDIIDNNIRTIGIDLPLSFGEDSTLSIIEFHVGLGNSVNSEMTLKNSIPIGLGKFDIQEESSIFTLTGLCDDENPRLFDPNGKSILAQNMPNPFTTEANVVFELPTDSHVKFYVVDMTGKTVLNIIDAKLVKGEHNVHIDASKLGTGIYRYILKTPYDVYSRTMQILK